AGMTDSGPFAAMFTANADVRISVQDIGRCSPTPADTNVVIQYKITDAGDVNGCAQGGQPCNGICELTADDPQNCGACGHVCSGTTPNCLDSECAPACYPDTGDCDHVASNGCEIDLTSDADNCGACGHQCTAQGANATGGICHDAQC